MDWRDEIHARFSDWETDAALRKWPVVHKALTIGQLVQGEVIARAPIGVWVDIRGVWVDIRVGFPALLLVPRMAGARDKRIKFEQYPALTIVVEGHIICLGDKGQIALTQRGMSAGDFSRDELRDSQ
jgi:hypothetical protein